jgi:hypothetical protein
MRSLDEAIAGLRPVIAKSGVCPQVTWPPHFAIAREDGRKTPFWLHAGYGPFRPLSLRALARFALARACARAAARFSRHLSHLQPLGVMTLR